MELINWWLKEMEFDSDKLSLLRTEDELSQFIPETASQDDISKKLSGLLPVNGDYFFSFNTSATEIIDGLFNKYVDEDTLVLTTGSEHPSVVNNLNKCKNVKILMNSNSLSFLDINYKKYKNIFIYVLSLSVGDNHYLSNSTFNLIKSNLIKSGLPCTFVLDAVQEMFLLPRDYSIFDYVIGTAHAIIPDFNMGILLSNKSKNYSEYLIERGYTYYELLKIILEKKSVLEQFNFVMYDYFKKFILNDSYLSQTTNGPFTFNLIDKKKRLYDLNEIDKLTIPKDYSPATFRACPAAIFSDRFLNKLKRVTARLSIG